jgi:beta-xylosidase
VGTEYYLVTSSFEYFPGLPIYHSSDLVHWSLLRHVLARQSQLNLRTVQPDGGVFAPSLRYHKERFYVTAAVVDKHSPAAEGEVSRISMCRGRSHSSQPLPGPRGFYVWTDDIREGEWSDPVYYDVLGIDQDVSATGSGLTSLYPVRIGLGVY